jgi:hypothetical protein
MVLISVRISFRSASSASCEQRTWSVTYGIQFLKQIWGDLRVASFLSVPPQRMAATVQGFIDMREVSIWTEICPKAGCKATALTVIGPGGPGALLPQGSHRPVRARFSAYGSSDQGFAASR